MWATEKEAGTCLGLPSVHWLQNSRKTQLLGPSIPVLFSCCVALDILTHIVCTVLIVIKQCGITIATNDSRHAPPLSFVQKPSQRSFPCRLLLRTNGYTITHAQLASLRAQTVARPILSTLPSYYCRPTLMRTSKGCRYVLQNSTPHT